MDSQQTKDYRETLVDAGVIFKMDLGHIDLGFEWAAKEPDETDAQIFAYIDRTHFKPHRILDLGCAYAKRLQRYTRTGIECVGVDILDTSKSIRATNQHLAANQKPAIDFIQADIRTLDAEKFAAQKFTVINCSQVIHFMNKDDIIELLKFIKKIAAPDTLICISLDTVDPKSNSPFLRLHNKISWYERAENLRQSQRRQLGDMSYRCYTDDDIRAAMECAGFHIHAKQSHQVGWTLFVANTQAELLFEQRPVATTKMGRILNYLTAQL